jgi:serine/threonine-protein kinase
MIMNAIIHSSKEVITPKIVGKDLNDALDEISKINCALEKSGEEFNQNVPNGIVLRQTPSAGMSIREGKTIKVVLSKGGEAIYVPDLFGQSVRAADALLMGANLIMGEVTRRYSSAAGKGFIVAQDIEPGTIVEKDSVVSVVISDGPPPEGTVLMPNFVNKKISEAKDWASKTSVDLKIVTQKSEGVENGIVVKQFPQADTDISSSKKAELYVSDSGN